MPQREIYVHGLPMGASAVRFSADVPFCVVGALFFDPASPAAVLPAVRLDTDRPEAGVAVPGKGVCQGGFLGLDYVPGFANAGTSVCVGFGYSSQVLYVATYSTTPPNFSLVDISSEI